MAKDTLPTKGKFSKKKNRQAVLETADDFLAQGVELEESAEKWRAGDAVKSARFYVKAIDCYTAGLEKFPTSFDLEYNRARAQYTITQYPLLRDQFPSRTSELLDTALQSHKRALALSPSNADVLFNTAQVLSSLAETFSDDPSDDTALKLLEEAVQHLQSCFELQETAFSAREQMLREVESQAAPAPSDGSPDTQRNNAPVDEDGVAENETWAFVEEPVTATTLLDTSIALADALTATCQAAANRSLLGKLSMCELSAQKYLQQKTQRYIDLAEPRDRTQACSSRARMKSALLDAAFVLSQIDMVGYDEGLAAAFDSEMTLIDGNEADFLCAHAECLQDFAVSTADMGDASSKRWLRLEKALALLAAASQQTKDPVMLSTIHSSRGDVEMLRLSISLSAQAPAALTGDNVRKTLVLNAQKFYKGAKLYAQSGHGGNAREGFEAAQIKEAIACAIELGENSPLKEIQNAGVPDESIKSALADVTNDLLLPHEILHSSGLA